MTGYAIVCEARTGASLGITTLALVDRSKSRDAWWTSDDPTLAINYSSEHAAAFVAKRLKMNRPRVVPFADAARLLDEQAAEIIHHEAMSDAEQGWDGHKGYF